ncbi:phage tail protein [Photorhabdus viridis]|uniref:phage tail protein n=1 Tax=Photorhabdus viridis TaxID=3163327 RepID=UPI00330770A4
MSIVSEIFEPSVSHRFMATFFFGGIIPSPVDIYFQQISGLSRELNVSTYREGGDNSSNLYLPENIQHGSLVLQRGVMAISPLTLNFNQVLSGISSSYLNVVVMLMNHLSLPVCSWVISKALPVKWSTSDLDANSNSILLNTLELRYRDMHWMGIKA